MGGFGEGAKERAGRKPGINGVELKGLHTDAFQTGNNNSVIILVRGCSISPTSHKIAVVVLVVLQKSARALPSVSTRSGRGVAPVQQPPREAQQAPKVIQR